MKPSLSSARQALSSTVAAVSKLANQNKTAGGKSLAKASSGAAQRAQPPAVGILNSYHRTMSAPMSTLRRFSSLSGKDKARSYSTDSGNTSFEKALLPHHPLDEKDHQTLKAVLGADLYEKLRHSRHQPGLCHADTTIKMIEAANGEVSPITSRLMNLSTAIAKTPFPFGYIGGVIGNVLNLGVPFYEGMKGNSSSYDKSQLLEHGVPKDSIAVVISATQGAIDPDSKQASAMSITFDIPQGGGSSAGNHAFAVLHVDHENGQMLCCDLDPYRQNADGTDKDVYFKVGKETFQERVFPRFNGVMAIKKQEAAE